MPPPRLRARAPAALYRVLGVHPSATHDEVKAAYQKLALKYHPDHAGEGGAARFMEATKAFQAITGRTEVGRIAARVPHAARWTVRSGTAASSQQKQTVLLFCGFSLLAGCGVFAGAYRMHSSLYGPRDGRFALRGGGTSVYRPRSKASPTDDSYR